MNVSGDQLQTVFPAVLHLLVFFCKLREVFWGPLLLSRNPSIHHQQGNQLQGEESSLIQGRWFRRGVIPTVILGLGYIQATLLSLGGILCCPLFLHTVFLSQKPWGFLTKLLSGNIFSSQLNSAILHGRRWLKYQGTPQSAAERAGDCQNAVRQEGKKQTCFWGAWLLGSSGRVWFTGWSLVCGYRQLASGGVLICNADLLCPLVGAAQLLLFSHWQLGNHQNHRPGSDGGTIECPGCTAAPGCSHPLSSRSIWEAALLTAKISADVQCTGLKAIRQRAVAEAANWRGAPSRAHPHRACCHYKQFNLELQLIVTSAEELLFFHHRKAAGMWARFQRLGWIH